MKTCERFQCTEEGAFKCVKCGVARYCGKACQNDDWPHHKPECMRLCELPQSERDALAAERGSDDYALSRTPLADGAGVGVGVGTGDSEDTSYGLPRSLAEAVVNGGDDIDEILLAHNDSSSALGELSDDGDGGVDRGRGRGSGRGKGGSKKGGKPRRKKAEPVVDMSVMMRMVLDIILPSSFYSLRDDTYAMTLVSLCCYAFPIAAGLACTWKELVLVCAAVLVVRRAQSYSAPLVGMLSSGDSDTGDASEVHTGSVGGSKRKGKAPAADGDGGSGVGDGSVEPQSNNANKKKSTPTNKRTESEGESEYTSMLWAVPWVAVWLYSTSLGLGSQSEAISWGEVMSTEFAAAVGLSVLCVWSPVTPFALVGCALQAVFYTFFVAADTNAWVAGVMSCSLLVSAAGIILSSRQLFGALLGYRRLTGESGKEKSE